MKIQLQARWFIHMQKSMGDGEEHLPPHTDWKKTLFVSMSYYFVFDWHTSDEAN